MRSGLAILALAAIVLPAATPAPTAGDLLAGFAAVRKGLNTYSVPVTMRGSVHVKIVSVPFTMHGTQYFQAPDKRALHVSDAPAMAKNFSNMVGSLGTPATWTATYDIALRGDQNYDGHLDDVLVGTPKRSGNVRNIAILLNPATYAIDTGTFTYQNGATIMFRLAYGSNPYNLPAAASVSAHFPDYSGSADITYGTYATNATLPASAFQQ